MAYATFGMQTPPIAFLDPSNEDEFTDFKSKMFDVLKRANKVKSMKEENKLLQELVKMIYDFLSNAEKELIESINQENEDIRLLAEQIQK